MVGIQCCYTSVAKAYFISTEQVEPGQFLSWPQGGAGVPNKTVYLATESKILLVSALNYDQDLQPVAITLPFLSLEFLFLF